jgi:hypothetical protein
MQAQPLDGLVGRARLDDPLFYAEVVDFTAPLAAGDRS